MRPEWLRVPVSGGETAGETRRLLGRLGLNTVCDQAKCPNRGHCYQRGTAAFLIMGSVCTRNCRYCAVESGVPGPPDPEEPGRVARAASAMGLRYAVVSSVTRDDLPDGGAGWFEAAVNALRKAVPGIRIEVLTPDFRGDRSSLETVARSRPDVINHNLETVERLFPSLRPGGDYRLSLAVLRRFRELSAGSPVKSGLMLGLGETDGDLDEALRELLEAGVSMLTLGQYLRPTRNHAPVERYVTPDEFLRLRDRALEMGFESVASGPLVRSSYHADLHAAPLL
jgi:lipoic acid synthetase